VISVLEFHGRRPLLCSQLLKTSSMDGLHKQHVWSETQLRTWTYYLRNWINTYSNFYTHIWYDGSDKWWWARWIDMVYEEALIMSEAAAVLFLSRDASSTRWSWRWFTNALAGVSLLLLLLLELDRYICGIINFERERRVGQMHGLFIYSSNSCSSICKICMYGPFASGTPFGMILYARLTSRAGYLKMALDMRYADSLHAHQLENPLRRCLCTQDLWREDICQHPIVFFHSCSSRSSTTTQSRDKWHLIWQPFTAKETS
jgi:hypothetical protein